MKRLDFDELLAECRAAGIPALPGSFSTDVLREIRLRSSETKEESGWFSQLFACLRPGMVAASLGLALVVGVLVPGLTRESVDSLAVDGLGLHVFSTSKTPSGLLK
ncbi:MAG: hypothetical protein WCG76_06740 [Verrucomicrobiota bacterium]